MSLSFLALPAPAANASGAGVDVSALGAEKTIVVEGNGGVFEPFVLIEVSNDTLGVNWSPLVMFNRPGEKTVAVACRWMRATVTNYRSGGAPTVNVGGEAVAASFATLPVPAGNGAGAGVDVSLLPPFKTIQLSGTFKGCVNIEVSNDGGATYSLATAFQSALQGIQSIELVAEFMRVVRTGAAGSNAGTPTIEIAAAPVATGGSSGAGTVFQYTVTGLEPVLDNLVIPLPVARANTNYAVFPSQDTFTNLLGMGVPTATKTVNDFVLGLSGDATAGDVFSFLVSDL